MNAFDIVMGVLTGVLVLYGLWKGMVRIAVSIAALVVAFLLASRFQEPVAQWLGKSGVQPTPAAVMAYLAIFLATILAGALVGWGLSKLLKAALLGWADRLAGAALGLVAALLAGAFVLHPVVASTQSGRSGLGASKLAPYVAAVADLANRAAPERLAESWRREIEPIRKVWRGDVQPVIDPVKKAAEAKERNGLE